MRAHETQYVNCFVRDKKRWKWKEGGEGRCQELLVMVVFGLGWARQELRGPLIEEPHVQLEVVSSLQCEPLLHISDPHLQ